MLGRPPRGSQVSYVDADNRQGAQAAVAHLVATGRRVIATITGPLDTAPGIDRLQGYRDALADGGVPFDPTLEAVGDFTQEGSVTAMERLLATHPEIDAVFAASDLMAASALSVITASGRRVPADVALVGFDDMAIALSTTPHLSSVRQPIEEMGHEMARLLVESLDHDRFRPTPGDPGHPARSSARRAQGGRRPESAGDRRMSRKGFDIQTR